MTTMPRRIDVAVIGAGQAGLTMSWHLGQAGREHLVLERWATLGGGWQDRQSDRGGSRVPVQAEEEG
jgi:putative flavoprotein involved in K+ transport